MEYSRKRGPLVFTGGSGLQVRRRSTYNYPSQKLKTPNRYDISLPLEKMYDVVSIVRDRLLPDTSTTRVVGYGHLGDSNLHLNVVVPDHDENVLSILEPFVFDWTTKHSGSISAEHGVGQCKNIYLSKSKPAEVISTMHGLKNMFDPNGILNPYKVLVN